MGWVTDNTDWSKYDNLKRLPPPQNAYPPKNDDLDVLDDLVPLTRPELPPVEQEAA